MTWVKGHSLRSKLILFPHFSFVTVGWILKETGTFVPDIEMVSQAYDLGWYLKGQGQS